jgi:hypothetical protein
VDNAVNTFYDTLNATSPSPITSNVIANAKSVYNLISVVGGAISGFVLFMGIISWLGSLSS